MRNGMYMEPSVIIGREFPENFKALCESSLESIDLLYYYWHIQPEARSGVIAGILDAMTSAVARGVNVRILTPSPAIASELRRMNFDAKQMHTGKTMHVKLALFDGKTALVGSHNMTRNAMQENWEVSLCVRFESEKNRLSQLFSNLWVL